MLKKLLMFLGVATFLYAATAQKIEFEGGSDKTFVMGHAGSTDCHVVFRNLTGAKADFVYHKIQDNFPTQWWVSFCDNINCYASLIDQDTFAPIADSGYAEFKVTVTPNGKADTAVVKYEMYEAQTPSDKDTVSFTFIVQWGADTRELKHTEITLYPNPASDRLFWSLASTTDGMIEVFAANGKKMLSEPCKAGNPSISIAALPEGFYYVNYTGENQVAKGSFVKK